MLLRYAFLFSATLGIGCLQSPVSTLFRPHVDPGRYVKTLEENGLERSYILRVPPKYDNKASIPLVVVLHGWTSNKEEAELYTNFGALSDKQGFILVVPDGTTGIGKARGWNTGFLNLGTAKADDSKFIGDIVDHVEKELRVDPKRLYIVGHSNGAMMAYAAGSNLSDRVAAIAVVSGTIGTPERRVDAPKTPVSAIIIHGKLDPTVPYDETSHAMIKSVSAPESARWWAQQDGCGPAQRTERDSGNVVIDDFKGGRNATEVEFVTIGNGKHSWPGGLTLQGPETETHVDASQMIWDFFVTHPKKS